MKKILKSEVIGPLMAFIFIFIIASVTTPRFLMLSNLSNQVLQVCIVSIVAIGATLIILTGGIDISPGAAIALETMLIASFIKNFNFNILTTFVLILIIGFILGAYNGFLVAFLRIPAFIATLASQGIFRGLAYLMNNGSPIQSLSPQLQNLFYGKLAGIPYPLFYVLILYAIFYFFMKYSQTGRRIYAIGGNSSASMLSGINVKKVMVVTYALAGMLTAIAAFMYSARLNSGSQNFGPGMEMDAIAAAVIGGVSLAGGKGNIIATFIGSATIVIVSNMLNLNAVPTAVQQIAIGGIIMIAVIIDMWRGDAAKSVGKLIEKNKIKSA